MIRNLTPSLLLIPCCIVVLILSSFKPVSEKEALKPGLTSYQDAPFIQEIHDAFKISDNPADNEVRSIAVDKAANVWIATASGIFCKKEGTREWKPVIPGEERGPAYSVVVNPDGAVIMGTWNGIFSFREQKLIKEDGVKPPISVVCNDGKSDYALGPYGIWRLKNGLWEQQDYKIARSVRDAIVDKKGNLWVATDAGLYKCRDGKSRLYQDVSELISCYARAISVNPS